jgi:hypothetical protein
LLVISPFLTNGILKNLAHLGQGRTLVSRLESLDELDENVRKGFERIYILDGMAEQDPMETASVPENEIIEQLTTTDTELTGLHAKLFVWEKGWNARWLIGSANATDAAFLHNVEFMIELRGKKSRIGIDAILGAENDRNAFRNLLQEYKTPEKKLTIGRDQKRAEELANEIRGWLLDCCLHLEVQKPGENYSLLLNPTQFPQPPSGTFSMRCWPISVTEIRSQAVLTGQHTPLACFNDLTIISLTTFMAFDITCQVGKARHNTRFALNLPITGLPVERDGAILSKVLSDQGQFMRYLRLLLMDDAQIAISVGWPSATGEKSSSQLGWENMEMPLLEELVKALSRSNALGGKIESIADLVERLKRSPEGQEIIPPEFDKLWQLILDARKAIT